MKFKSLFSVVGVALALLAFAPVARAQKAQPYTQSFITTNTAFTTNSLVAATTNYFGLGATNTCIFTVSDFDKAGVTITYQGTGASTATGKAFWVRSFDGANHFETLPIAANTVPLLLAGTTPQTICTNLDMSGATHLQLFYIENSASVGITNIILTVNCKSPKFGAKAATQ